MPDLYYMAPGNNAPLITVCGVLSCNQLRRHEALAELTVSIADPSVNSRRRDRVVDGRPLHDYVPLYWATHTPMQYVVTQKERRLRQEDLVFFVFDSNDVLDVPGVLTTDGNAASEATTFYRGRAGLQYLDWKILRTRDCYSPEYKRRKAAEVLVPGKIDAALIKHVAVLSAMARVGLLVALGELRETLDLAVELPPIQVDPNLYY